MDAKESIEVNALLGNKKSGGEDEIAAEIKRLNKKQKKAQIRTGLCHLREHKAWEFVKDILKQKFYAQRLALEKAQKVCDRDVYFGKSQCTFNKYVSQVDLDFWTKHLMYVSKEAKCLYVAAFLAGIPQLEWVAENQRIKADPD